MEAVELLWSWVQVTGVPFGNKYVLVVLKDQETVLL